MSVVMPMMVEETSRDDQSRSTPPTESHFASKMYFYGREICFLLAIIFTSYAALHNGTPKVSKSPAPTPFFTRTSLVADFYHGQLGAAFERVSESDISFVMYYAPWDAESQILRSQFKAVAQYYYKQVYFAAINCWQPLSECRQQFSKIQMFPVLIAYSQHSKGIQYKGVKEAPHMIRFLRHMMRPVERIERSEDLVTLLTSHDAVVVGSFNFLGNVGGRGFHTFYSTALKFLERDPHREIAFGVVTDEKAATRLGIHFAPTIRLYLWNETLEYSAAKDYSVDTLVKWCSVNTHQVSVWVSPPGVKSLTLSPYVEEGSVLILFTPRNPFLLQDLDYNLLREVGLEYYNCDGNPWVQDLGRYLSEHREDTQSTQQSAEQGCQVSRARPRREFVSAPVQVVGEEPWANDSCPSVAHRRSRRLCGVCQQAGRGHASVFEDACSGGVSAGSGYGPQRRHYVCCKQRPVDRVTISLTNRRPATSMWTGEDDPRAPAALLDAEQVENCRRVRRASQLHPLVFPRSSKQHANLSLFQGLACRTNKTLSLLAMDSLQFGHFARGLGVNLTTQPDHTAAVVVDAADESAYLMSTPLSKQSLKDFISHYTVGQLDRTRRSSSVEEGVTPNRFPEVPPSLCSLSGNTVCVPELTTQTFLPVVMDQTQNVMVLYHSPFCAFCQGISHLFLTAARYFRGVDNVTFARIDGENNDLAWEFTMDHYPTILFFPAKRKSESRVFPYNQPITVPNLVNFLLANLDSKASHLQAVIGLCSGWSRTDDPLAARNCVARARRECLRAVSDALSRYRSVALRWQVAQASDLSARSLAGHRRHLQAQTRRLLFELQHLREVQVLLGAADSLAPGGRELGAVRRSFQLYQHALARDATTTSPAHDEL